MQEDMNNAPLMDDEEGIDIMALVKQLWDGRKTIIIWTCARGMEFGQLLNVGI